METINPPIQKLEVSAIAVLRKFHGSCLTLGVRLFPDDAIAAVSHLFHQRPPASSHSEGEVRVELQEVVGDVGEVGEDPRGGQGAGE